MFLFDHILRLTGSLSIGLYAMGLTLIGDTLGFQIPTVLRVVIWGIASGIIVASFLSNYRKSFIDGRISNGYSNWGKGCASIANFLAVGLLIIGSLGILVARSPSDPAERLEGTLARYLELSTIAEVKETDLIRSTYSIYSQCEKAKEIRDVPVRVTAQSQCQTLLGKPISSEAAKRALLALKQANPIQ